MSKTSELRLPLILAEQAQKHVTHNEALRALDALVQLAAKTRDRTAPPAAPAGGDRHIVAAAATGDWAGHDGEIAAWQDGAWAFYPPRAGWRCWVAEEAALFAFDGSDWTVLGGSGDLQTVGFFGLGTTADAESPFAAKLNKALWAAAETSEGGDGSLRYTMSKQAAADVLSLILQSGFSGRAEIGLVGDNDLIVKVSPDGAQWIEALRIDKDDGAALFNGVATIDRSGGALPAPPADTQVHVKGEPGRAARFVVDTMGTSTSHAPNFVYRWARNSGGSPAAAQADDILGLFSWFGHGGTGYSNARVQVRGVANENWSDAAQGTRLAIFVTPNGSTALAERFAVENGGALTMGGAANVVIDANRHVRLRSYTATTLPSAAPAGQVVHVSNGASNRFLAISDGSNWRFPDGSIVF